MAQRSARGRLSAERQARLSALPGWSWRVRGDGAGSKADKAQALGVRIMPAEEFAALHAALA